MVLLIRDSEVITCVAVVAVANIFAGAGTQKHFKPPRIPVPVSRQHESCLSFVVLEVNIVKLLPNNQSDLARHAEPPP